MTINDIEKYLCKRNEDFDNKVMESIEGFRLDAISKQCEEQANYCWCLRQIFKIQKQYISAFNALKKHKYEDAWCLFDKADIDLSFLERNFEIDQDSDKYHLVFIGRMIKEYQKLFPFRYFLSRESIILSEKCSICGCPISIRHPCCHKTGKVYMGELCTREVTDLKFLATSIVTDPFDKYAYLKIDGQEYNYGMLDKLLTEIKSPYEGFHVEIVKIKKPEYKNIGRNMLCPCGSGKKYKKCHLDTNDELMNHYIVQIAEQEGQQKQLPEYFSSWK